MKSDLTGRPFACAPGFLGENLTIVTAITVVMLGIVALAIFWLRPFLCSPGWIGWAEILPILAMIVVFARFLIIWVYKFPLHTEITKGERRLLSWSTAILAVAMLGIPLVLGIWPADPTDGGGLGRIVLGFCAGIAFMITLDDNSDI